MTTPVTVYARLTSGHVGLRARIAAAARLLFSVQRDFFTEAAAARPPGINLAVAGIIRQYVAMTLARKFPDVALRDLFRVLGDPEATWSSIGVNEEDQAELEAAGVQFDAVRQAVFQVLVTYATVVLLQAANDITLASQIEDPPPEEEAEPLEQEEPAEDPGEVPPP